MRRFRRLLPYLLCASLFLLCGGRPASYALSGESPNAPYPERPGSASNTIPAHPASPATEIPSADQDDTVPRPIGYVNDYEKLFTPAQQQSMDSLIAAFEHRTTIEIALVTIDSSMTDKIGFDDFTLRVMAVWGVGKAEKNNGIVVGVSRYYRRIRIQNGSAILKVMPNSVSKAIIDEAFIPSFRKGQYFEGTWNGLRAIMQRLE